MLVRTVLLFRKLTIWKGNWRLWKKNNWGVQMAITETLVLKFMRLLWQCQNRWKLWSTYVGIVCDPTENSVSNGGRPVLSPLRPLDFLPQKFNLQVKPHWFVVSLTLGISLDLLPDIPSSTTSMTTCKQPCKVQKQIIQDAAILWP